MIEKELRIVFNNVVTWSTIEEVHGINLPLIGWRNIH